MSLMTILPISPIPTSGPGGLGGITPAILLSNTRGILSGAAANGSATVMLLAWSVALQKWDYVYDPQGPNQRLSITPSSGPGGAESKTFYNPAPTYYMAMLGTAAPSGDVNNLTVDLSAASGSDAYSRTQIWAKTVAAKSGTAIHAAYAGNNATNTFPGPISAPDVPRNLSAVAQANYDGGALTIVGINQFDESVTEVITPVAASTVYGTKVFKSVSSITKAAVGANSATVSVGTGDVIGVDFRIENVTPKAYALFVSQVAEAASVVNPTYSSFTPSTTPNSQVFTFIANRA